MIIYYNIFGTLLCFYPTIFCVILFFATSFHKPPTGLVVTNS